MWEQPFEPDATHSSWQAIGMEQMILMDVTQDKKLSLKLRNLIMTAISAQTYSRDKSENSLVIKNHTEATLEPKTS